jgi:ketosteroid isomerase-like protein
VTRNDVMAWVAAYERVWRSPGTDQLAGLFADDATYLVSPWAEPVRGLEAIGALWEAERDGPEEEFTMTSEVVALDGAVAVVRAEVEYAATGNRWRDLWILCFAPNGLCAAFEEWPFAPDQPHG